MKFGPRRASGRQPRQRGAVRSIIEHRRLIGLSAGRLGLVGVFAVITGLGQAALLLLVVRIATALTADVDTVSGSIGPFGSLDLTTGELTLIAFLLLLGLFVAELAGSWAQASLGATAQRSTKKRMLAKYSAAGFDTQTLLPRGERAAVVVGQSGQAASLVSTLGSGLGAVVNFGSLVFAALALSPVAGLVVVCGLVAMLLALRPLNRWSRRLSRRRADAQRLSGALVAARFELTQEIKAFGTDHQADAPIRAEIDTLTQLSERLGIVSRMTSAIYRIGAYSLILGMMAIIDAADSQSLTSLTGALLIMLRSLSYGQSSQRLYLQLIQGLPVVEQLAAESRRLVEGAERVGGATPSSGIGNLVLRQVCFAYRAGEPVLHDVSLEIRKGDFVAVVGSSGAGKSTLMNLLLQLRWPTSGDILVDGLPISEIDLAWWRARVAYVPQEPKLQAGSVTETIRFNRRGISDADVRRAAQQAHISDEIESWPDGYETEVGQLGDQVSGGQRQRIALARALAGGPDLLLLDEPTSALDPRSEKLISETLEELRGVMTVVVIAHRFHTVERANRVVLLQDGRVVPHQTDDLTTLGDFMGQSEVVDTTT